MSNSPLISYIKLSPNRTSPRIHTIDTITIHCVVGQWTAKQGCDYFAATTEPASPNYFVGKDGSIGLSVDEGDRSWCSSSAANDHRAITIETASDTFAPYAVTTEAYTALIDLVTDICQRNGKTKITWLGDKNKTLAYAPADDEMVMTVHRWFANKACPGDYLYSRHGAIAAEVNRRLEETMKTKEDDIMTGKEIVEALTPDQCVAILREARGTLQDNDASEYSEEARQWAVDTGLVTGGSEDTFNGMWEDVLTREQLVTVLYRFAKLAGMV